MGKDTGLRLWHGARELADEIVEACRRSNAYDFANLRSQLADAANSVPSNISEALGRELLREKLYFLRVARASLEETKSHLRGGVNTNLLDRQTFYRFWNRSVALGRMLASYIANAQRGGAANGSGPAKGTELREQRGRRQGRPSRKPREGH